MLSQRLEESTSALRLLHADWFDMPDPVPCLARDRKAVALWELESSDSQWRTQQRVPEVQSVLETRTRAFSAAGRPSLTALSPWENHRVSSVEGL